MEGPSLQHHLGFYRNKHAALLMMSGGQRRAGLPATICNQLDPKNLANAGSDKRINVGLLAIPVSCCGLNCL